jgi:tetratricopeptide (TPR) repeat protein
MKRIITYILFAGVLSGLSSCKKFLDQASQDLIRPVTVEHYKELLQGEGYFKDMYRNGWFVDVMTDDIMLLDLAYPTTVVNAKTEASKFAYQWGHDLEDPTGTFTDKLFQTMYKNILAANTCLEALDKATGTEAEKKVLRGQALFTRAYGYFVLANLYSKIYSTENLDELCVPLTTETSPSLKRYNRAKIKEVWDIISSDIETAVADLSGDQGTRTVYEINYKAALLFASRVFLYMQQYDKAIEYGERFLLLHPKLFDITGYTNSPSPTGTHANKAFLLVNHNPEIVFTFSRFSSASGEGGYVYFTREPVGLSPHTYSASFNSYSPLINSYGANDRRKNYWFSQPTGAPGLILSYPAYTPMKLNYYEGARTSQYMRSAEVYLNLAEAYAKKPSPNNGRAIDLLNQLRSNRIASYTDLTAGDFADQQALITFILEERRRELCFEEFHRWWDLRRNGQPYLEHVWLTDTYKLNQNDAGYVLNFPRYELEFNPDLVPNVRPVRNP